MKCVYTTPSRVFSEKEDVNKLTSRMLNALLKMIVTLDSFALSSGGTAGEG